VVCLDAQVLLHHRGMRCFSFILMLCGGCGHRNLVYKIYWSDGMLSFGAVTIDETVAASDYQPVSGDPVFADGETSKAIEVMLLDDVTCEDYELLDDGKVICSFK